MDYRGGYSYRIRSHDLPYRAYTFSYQSYSEHDPAVRLEIQMTVTQKPKIPEAQKEK